MLKMYNLSKSDHGQSFCARICKKCLVARALVSAHLLMDLLARAR
jgi:hypothetical protein